ncbi:hypothetical protein [uncultured Veillonella sp.]|uniref:hypothetical protein n=1 Tax=uncultured Veillonella sp. TaxID=159268 RepID=UPI0025D5ADC3|nr:hypothetical protein [uncultured Veillonella sp.]
MVNQEVDKVKDAKIQLFGFMWYECAHLAEITTDNEGNKIYRTYPDGRTSWTYDASIHGKLNNWYESDVYCIEGLEETN